MWAGALTLAAALVLTACGPSAEAPADGSPSPTPAATTPAATPDATPTPTESESPAPSAEAVVLPSCELLLPLSVAQAQLGGDTQALPSEGPTPAEIMPGPAAADAVRAAVQSTVCLWGIPNSDGGFHVVTAELTASARDELVAALRAAGTFTEATVGGESSFTREFPSEIGTRSGTYVFVGPVWITVIGSLSQEGSRTVAGAALEGVRAANPTL